jgi:hypothetical protein
MTALARYEQMVAFADAGLKISWQALADELRAEAAQYTGCARRKRIDRALECESRALAQRTAAAYRQEVAEAQLKCETCINGHALGRLRKPCGVSGCECWCNR